VRSGRSLKPTVASAMSPLPSRSNSLYLDTHRKIGPYLPQSFVFFFV
jgi:hypothetical protein